MSNPIPDSLRKARELAVRLHVIDYHPHPQQECPPGCGAPLAWTEPILEAITAAEKRSRAEAFEEAAKACDEEARRNYAEESNNMAYGAEYCADAIRRLADEAGRG